MKYFSVKLPELYIGKIDKYVEIGLYRSRAEMVRFALTKHLAELEDKYHVEDVGVNR
jgi:Arc/MetJ-type ribon-helix-helix transcriptional regulator